MKRFKNRKRSHIKQVRLAVDVLNSDVLLKQHYTMFNKISMLEDYGTFNTVNLSSYHFPRRPYKMSHRSGSSRIVSIMFEKIYK